MVIPVTVVLFVRTRTLSLLTEVDASTPCEFRFPQIWNPSLYDRYLGYGCSEVTAVTMLLTTMTNDSLNYVPTYILFQIKRTFSSDDRYKFSTKILKILR